MKRILTLPFDALERVRFGTCQELRVCLYLPRAEYERLMACDAVCADVPDEKLAEAALQGGVSVIKTVALNELVRRARQRDDLLTSLKKARDYIDNCGAQAGAQKAIDDIDAVIAKLGAA